MPISALAVGDGGAIGWLFPESIEFPDSGAPTLCYIQMAYKVSGIAVPQTLTFISDTTLTQAAIRSSAKDTIKQHILDNFGINIPKSAIKMANSLE